jgi:hypothetical protein
MRGVQRTSRFHCEASRKCVAYRNLASQPKQMENEIDSEANGSELTTVGSACVRDTNLAISSSCESAMVGGVAGLWLYVVLRQDQSLITIWR